MNSEKIEKPTVFEDHQTKRLCFLQDLETLINRHSMENGSDTPDFLLAEYLLQLLELFDVVVERREQWYGRNSCPAEDNAETSEVILINKYQQRVVEEKAELDNKIKKLMAFMRGEVFANLPEDEQARLHRQERCMREYSGILEGRINNFV